MISYTDIRSANDTLKFSDIKGKNYAEVPQRVKAFRMLFPDGYIVTDMISNENGVCVFKATAGYYDVDGSARTLGTGTAYEKEGSSYINKTSYIENCETSAVGRALGFLGLGSDTSIASYEEVQNAIRNQNDDLVKPGDAKAIKEEMQKKGNWDVRKQIQIWCERMGINGEQFNACRTSLIRGGVVANIKFDDLEPVDLENLLDAISKNYPDMLKGLRK